MILAQIGIKCPWNEWNGMAWHGMTTGRFWRIKAGKRHTVIVISLYIPFYISLHSTSSTS